MPSSPLVDYEDLDALSISVDDGVARVQMTFRSGDEGGGLRQHDQLVQVWPLLDRDSRVRSVLLTGPRDGDFYPSGRPPVLRPLESGELWSKVMWLQEECGGLVQAMASCSKPVVSAILGTASGAGLTVALMADISVAAESSVFFDPHVLMGVAAGDGAGVLWSQFAGLPKAKMYLLTSEALSGAEADRIGLVSCAVPADQVIERSLYFAKKLATGPQHAIRLTKRSLDRFRSAGDLLAQDHSLAMQMISEASGERSGAPYFPYPPEVWR